MMIASSTSVGSLSRDTALDNQGNIYTLLPLFVKLAVGLLVEHKICSASTGNLTAPLA